MQSLSKARRSAKRLLGYCPTALRRSGVLAASLLVLATRSTVALAQAAPAPAASATVSFTSLLLSLAAAGIPIVGAVALALVNKYVKDASAAKLIDDAIASSVGTLQQVAQGSIKTVDPSLVFPAKFAAYAPGIQYVVDHAGDALTRLGITPEMVAEKIEAKVGLANVAHNLAVTSSASTTTAPPLSPVVPAPAA